MKHYVHIREDNLPDDPQKIHGIVTQLITAGATLPQEQYNGIKHSWSLLSPTVILIESNHVEETSTLIPVTMPKEGVFALRFDPLHSLPAQGKGKRGRKSPISTEGEATTWLTKRLPQDSTLLFVRYEGWIKLPRFQGYSWNAAIQVTAPLDSYHVSGCSRPFGFGLLTPSTQDIHL